MKHHKTQRSDKCRNIYEAGIAEQKKCQGPTHNCKSDQHPEAFLVFKHGDDCTTTCQHSLLACAGYPFHPPAFALNNGSCGPAVVVIEEVRIDVDMTTHPSWNQCK